MASREYQRELRRWRKEHGICTICGKEKVFTGVVCEGCREKMNKKAREKYHSMTPEEKEKYLANISKRRKERRVERRKQGLCVCCGKPVYADYSMCYEHLLKQKRVSKEARDRKKAGA